MSRDVPRGARFHADLHGAHLLVRSPLPRWLILGVLAGQLCLAGGLLFLLLFVWRPPVLFGDVGGTIVSGFLLAAFAVLCLSAWMLTGRELDLLVQGSRLTLRYRYLGLLAPGRWTYDLAGGSVGFTYQALVVSPRNGKPGTVRIGEGLGPWLVEQLAPALQLQGGEQEGAPEAVRRLVSAASTSKDAL